MAASYTIRFRGGVRSSFLISIGSGQSTIVVPLYISPLCILCILSSAQ